MTIKFIIFFNFLLSCTSLFSQSFEGEIIYENHFESHIKNLTDNQLGSMIGTKQEYFIKGGDYKSLINGNIAIMQLYENETNRIYTKTPKSDTLYWIDASMNEDSVISYELKKDAGYVLGYKCDALILKTKTGTSTFYYSSVFKLNSEKFKMHNYDNWAFYTKETESLPLKIIIENNQFKLESIATEIKSIKLNQKYFIINKKTPIKKNS